MLRRIVLVAALLAVAACGSDAQVDLASTDPPANPPGTVPPDTTPPETRPPVDPASIELPADPDAVVIQIDLGVNQPDPIAVASGYPLLTVYADGRVIARDPSVLSGPLPPLTIARITGDGVRELLALAIEHGGLDPLDSYGWPNVADDDGLGFVIATADRRSEFGVYGLGSEGSPDDEITPEQLRGRRDLQQLRRALLGWRTTVAEHVVEPPSLFTGDEILVILWSEFDVEWLDLPVDLTGGGSYETRVDSVYCVEVPVAESPAFVETLFDEPFHPDVAYRQVLPHEPGCAVVSEL